MIDRAWNRPIGASVSTAPPLFHLTILGHTGRSVFACEEILSDIQMPDCDIAGIKRIARMIGAIRDYSSGLWTPRPVECRDYLVVYGSVNPHRISVKVVKNYWIATRFWAPKNIAGLKVGRHGGVVVVRVTLRDSMACGVQKALVVMICSI